jgi:hypothetical protein
VVGVGEQGRQVPAGPGVGDPDADRERDRPASAPVTRGGGPVSRAAIWIARRLVIPGTMRLYSSPP